MILTSNALVTNTRTIVQANISATANANVWTVITTAQAHQMVATIVAVIITIQPSFRIFLVWAGTPGGSRTQLESGRASLQNVSPRLFQVLVWTHPQVQWL